MFMRLNMCKKRDRGAGKEIEDERKRQRDPQKTQPPLPGYTPPFAPSPFHRHPPSSIFFLSLRPSRSHAASCGSLRSVLCPSHSLLERHLSSLIRFLSLCPLGVSLILSCYFLFLLFSISTNSESYRYILNSQVKPDFK